MLAEIDQNNVLWIIITVPLLLMAAAVGMWLIRRKFKPDQPPPDSNDVSFTLDQLRQLHSQGQISDKEFQRLKGKILKETRSDNSDA